MKTRPVLQMLMKMKDYNTLIRLFDCEISKTNFYKAMFT